MTNPYAQLEQEVAAAPANPYAELERDVATEADQERSLAAWRASNSDVAPETAVDVIQLSAASGLAPEHVAENLDAVKASVTREQLAGQLKTRPALAKLMQDAGRAPLVKDDAANLGWLEWSLTGDLQYVPRQRMDENGRVVTEDGEWRYTGPAWARALVQGARDVELMHRSSLAAFGDKDQEERIRELEATGEIDFIGERDPGFIGRVRGYVAGMVTGGARALPMLAARQLVSALGGTMGAASGALLTAKAGPASAAGAAAGRVVGEIAAGAAADFWFNVGGLNRQLRALKGPQGEQLLDAEDARDMAVAASLGISGVTGLLGAGLPPVFTKAFQGVVGRGMSRALAQQTTRQAAAKFAVRTAGHVGVGGLYMASQSAGNAATVELARSIGGQENWSRVADAAGHAFAQGVQDMAILSAWGPGRRFLEDVGRAQFATRARAADAVELAAAKDSKFVDRSPAEAERYLQDLANQGQESSRFVLLDAWQKLWQDERVDPRQAAAEIVGDGGKAYDAAVASGGDLAIPAGAWLAKVARTPAGEKLRPDVRRAAGELTAREADAANAELSKRVAELAKAPPAAALDAFQVFEREQAKATAAGVDGVEAEAFARLRAANVTALAERYGGTALEWYGRLGELEIVGPKGKLVELPMDPRAPAGGGQIIEGVRLEQSAWEAHISKDGNEITQEMTPLDIKGVGVPDPKRPDALGTIRVSLNEGRARDGKVDALAQTQEMAPLRLDKDGRGYIEFAPNNGEPFRARITLLAGTDRSTLAHETGHFLTEALARVAAGDKGAPDLRTDMEALAKFAGYGSLEERTKALVPAYEERISHAWETYLAEGRAPSAELVGVFSKFRRWMGAIYKAVTGIAEQYKAKYGEELKISDEARRIFDRWLAVEDELGRTSAAEDAQPFRKLMTPEEQAQHDKLQAAALGDAEQRLIGRLAAAESKEAKRELKAAREQTETEVAAAVAKNPVQIAREFLVSGQMPRGQRVPDGVAPGSKIDKAVLVDRYGKDFVHAMPKGLAERGGVHPDSVAEAFGFKSGDELVRALAASEHRDVAIANEVQRRLQAEHPTLLERPAEFAAAALDATRTDAGMKVILLKASAIRRQLDPLTDPRAPIADVPSIRATAERIAAESKVGDLSPGYHLQAERAAARKATEAAAAGKLAEAHDQLALQALNRELWRAAKEARAQAESDVAALRVFTKDDARAKLGLAGDAYLAQVDNLLDGFELRDGVSRKEAGRRLATMQWIAEEQAAGRDPIIPESVLARLDRFVHWKELTPNELADLREGVESIAHQAELKRTIVDGQKRRSFDEGKAELIADADASGTREPTQAQRSPEGIIAGIKRAAYGVAKIEELLRQFGPSWTRLIWDPINRAHNEHVELIRRVGEPITKIINELPTADLKRWRETRFTVNGQAHDLFAAITVALNLGNASNRKKLIEGWGHKSVADEGLVPWGANTHEEFTRHLTKRDWEIVQQVWTSLDGLWPEIAALEKRLTGLEPKGVKAEAFTVTTADGETVKLRGGYFPLVYDRRFSRQGAQAAEQMALNGVKPIFDRDYARAATPQGHIAERVEGFVRPIDLEAFELLPRKIAESTKDLAFREAAISVQKLLTDADVRRSIRQTRGEAAEVAIQGWLRDTVNDLVIPDNGAGKWLSFSNKLRSNFVAGLFAYNIGQTMQNLAGFIPATRAVGVGHMTSALLEFAKDRRAALELVHSLSGEMRARDVGGLPGVGDALQDLRQRKGYGAQLAEFGLAVFAATDKAVAIPTFLAAFRAGEARGLGHAEAVAFAEQTVRLKVGSGATKDLPALTRSQTGKWLAPLMGFALNRANQLWGAKADAGKAWNDGHRWAAAKIIGATLAALAAEAVLSELLTGKGPKDENDDGAITVGDAARWGAKSALLSFPKMIPLLGTMIRSMESGRDASLAPEIRVLSATAKALGGAAKLATQDDPIEQEQVLAAAGAALEAFGWASGLPTAQVATTVKYLSKIRSGDEQPQSAAEIVFGVAHGPRRAGRLNEAVFGQ